MIVGVFGLRRLIVLLAVPLVASCSTPWQASNGLAPTPAPSVTTSPVAVPTASGPTAPPAVEAVSACSLTGVLITAERGEAAMGYREMALTVRNCGTEPYEVKGRPDIVVLDEDGRPLKISIVPSNYYTAPPKRLVLKPGTSALTMLSWRNTVTNISGAADTGASLAVAVSKGGTRQLVTLPSPLDLGNTGQLRASVWF
ncbi:DUF4232 domain-containing protein [Paractinoplanes atraurantiacus]|uniref:DUF4232 domain-containing protein n=1 Tax=Paractinoplanes atraurantiacus TaxID=1036182 RepID=A0A285KKJ4_9ACTN|nr:DUF4232 domain-containing protein [Actinoplanes atraurantiacus]SNY73138.1 Protein of unknown function [Actinoplanes atraurantiacus]